MLCVECHLLAMCCIIQDVSTFDIYVIHSVQLLSQMKHFMATAFFVMTILNTLQMLGILE